MSSSVSSVVERMRVKTALGSGHGKYMRFHELLQNLPSEITHRASTTDTGREVFL
jgi:hypothetical protein